MLLQCGCDAQPVNRPDASCADRCFAVGLSPSLVRHQAGLKKWHKHFLWPGEYGFAYDVVIDSLRRKLYNMQVSRRSGSVALLNCCFSTLNSIRDARSGCAAADLSSSVADAPHPSPRPGSWFAAQARYGHFNLEPQ